LPASQERALKDTAPKFDTHIKISLLNSQQATMNDSDFTVLIRNSYPNHNTAHNYIVRLKKLQQACSDSHSGALLPIHIILSKPAVYYDKIRASYPNINTRKNMLTLILSLFKFSPELRVELEAQHKRWKKYHEDMDGFQEARISKGMPSVEQLAKYTPMEEIRLKYDELKRGDPHTDRQTSLHFILLSICLNTPPKRSNYGSMRIYRDTDPNIKDTNYLVLHSPEGRVPSYMVFTQFKTAKTYQRIDEVLNKQLYKDVCDSLRRHPRDYLFVNRFGQPFKTNHLYSIYVIACFQRMFGRKTGTSMFRHIYITEELDFNNLSIEDKDDIARQMMHSKGLQEKYAWSKKKICEAMAHLCDDCSKDEAAV
jgi:hypothetical protein